MTLKKRNKLYLALNLFAILVIILLTSFTIIKGLKGSLQVPPIAERAIKLPGVFLFNYSLIASICAIIFLTLYTPIAGFFVYINFEKTQASEIIYFAGFLLACIFESTRLLVPLFELWKIFTPFTIFVGKSVFFGRFLASLCFLFAGIFSNSELANQDDRNLYIVIAAALSVATLIPINTTKIYSNFMVSHGFASGIFLLRCCFVFITFAIFLMIGRLRELPEYIHAAWGYLFLMCGYVMLSMSDSWIFTIVGATWLFWGTRLFLKSLHKYYLWK